ncbi:autoinducer binding domain-containing protein [Bradyrhizobium sp. CSA207]|uniref:autoinducer binding domain-containing protein n=1 Tax=Bradyrhizobium sp. CSA207 TaxID=2698826 RepID=UPI0031835640
MKFPPDWCERYFERKYYAIDPVVRRAPMLSGRSCGTNSPNNINCNPASNVSWRRPERQA